MKSDDGARVSTRERIASAAGTLFRRQGYAATGLQQIAGTSGAQIGSIYHHFTDKQSLAEESIRADGVAYGLLVFGHLENGGDDPVEALGNTFRQAAADLVATDYADACPIAGLALEVAGTNEVLRTATAEVFTAWIDGLALWCRRIVDDEGRARELAVAILTQLEGAFILARSLRDPEPLLLSAQAVTRLARAYATESAAGAVRATPTDTSPRSNVGECR